MYIVKPDLRQFLIHGRFVSPVAHNDATQSDGSNTSLFRRQKHLVERDSSSIPDAVTVQRIVASQPVPASIAQIMQELSIPEFLAVAFAARFVLLYNSKDGAGLFSGAGRYSMLETRLKHNAVRASTAFNFWGGLVRDMNAGLMATHDDALNALLTMPSALANLVLGEIAANSAAAIMLARTWYDSRADEAVTISLPDVQFNTALRAVVNLPAISANSIRHEMIREPGALHMLNALGLKFNDLNAGAAALLYNGGDMNRSPESNAFALRREIVERYPLLALEGGAASGFLLGTSLVQVHAWLLCRENNDSTAQFGLTSDISAFELLDRVEHTRHNGGIVTTSPMIYGMETLAKGAEFVVRFAMTPYAEEIHIGALVAALETYLDSDKTLFGQAAKGYGLIEADFLQVPNYNIVALRQQYETYLAENAQVLRNGLLDGTLSTDSKVLA